MRTLLASLLCSLLLVPQAAHAKDLRGRVGVGFNNQFGSVSALSARYGLPTANPAFNIQGEIAFGLTEYTAATFAPNSLFAGARALYGVVAEDNMNLYGTAGIGWIMTGDERIVRLQPGISAEAFLFGLENLGVSAEWGLNLDAGTQSGVMTTAGVGVAVHYWF